jgi:CTP:phosphocholine cytidylyltransferase-like protein
MHIGNSGFFGVGWGDVEVLDDMPWSYIVNIFASEISTSVYFNVCLSIPTDEYVSVFGGPNILPLAAVEIDQGNENPPGH